MKVVTFSGPPSSGKTSVILKLIGALGGAGRIGVVKFDCLTSRDGDIYRAAGVEVKTGVSGAVCPDHFFASNIDACMAWGRSRGFDLLISESAGLCNRCSPHLRGAPAACVVDILAGLDAPRKIGPMLKLADFVVVTKSDLVSQAEREVFALHVVRANPRARIVFANGLTGQGILSLAHLLEDAIARADHTVERLRFSMPGAVCSFCFGDTKVGTKYATGNIKYMSFGDEPAGEKPALAEKPAAEKPAPAVGRAVPSDPAALLDRPFGEVVREHPLCAGFFDEMGLARPDAGRSVRAFAEGLDEFALSDCGMGVEALLEAFSAYLTRVEGIAAGTAGTVRELRVVGGTDKDGAPEGLDVTVRAGEVACIVGPTGSGKSRLLEDIEYLAQGDTPTGRRVLVDGALPGDEVRLTVENGLVAQLSQGMTFVMDMGARDFVRLHAQSRMIDEALVEPTVARVLACANDLAGEPFGPDTSLTQLSGGQSRALMIADLAFVSAAPVVLIDEIENAGVDRMKALDLLVSSDKVVFVVTHDPLIALQGDLRLVVGNGAVRDVVRPGPTERANAAALAAVDARLTALRGMVRAGERLDAPFDELWRDAPRTS